MIKHELYAYEAKQLGLGTDPFDSDEHLLRV